MNPEEVPLVSVCITTYQHAPFIRQCLDGVLMQETAFPFEILLGEHDSADGTRKICIEYAERHPERIRLFLHERSTAVIIAGVSTGRNNFLNNLRNARGKYIALCEGDDCWTEKSKLQKQVDVLENSSDLVGSFHDAWIVVEATGKRRRMLGPEQAGSTLDISALITGRLMPTASLAFRNCLWWDQLPSWFNRTILGDHALTLALAEKGLWRCVDGCMSVFRIHPGGISSRKSRVTRLKRRIHFYQLLIESGDFDDFRGLLLRKVADELRRLSLAEFRTGHVGHAAISLAASLRSMWHIS